MSLVDWFLFVFAALGGLGGLAACLSWAGVAPASLRQWGIATVASNGKLYFGLALFVLSWAMSGISLYVGLHHDCSKIPSFNMDIVEGRSFRNEEVPLDGRKYVNCTFENVTFVFEGQGAFGFDNSRFVRLLSPQLRTRNQIIGATVQLLQMIQSAGGPGKSLQVGGGPTNP